ncbi:MAG TPA: hypothetical protein VID04_01275 [Methylomirabilota bacterium]
MRRVVVLLLSAVAILGILTPPVLAQTPAPAPAPMPKVTINGLVDFVTTAYGNWPDLDVTDPRDKGWYSRERGVFTFTGEIGKAKGVWAVELDFTNGFVGPGNSGGAVPGSGPGFPGTTTGFDLDTDVAGAVETKWLYLEAPVTGAGSMLPFIPFASIIRAGGQPARGHDYKFGILLSGDIPGVAWEATFAPNLRSTLTYVQGREKIDPLQNPGGAESWALVASVEVDLFKGFTLKPTYAYADFTGGSGNNALGLPNTSGLNFNGTNNKMYRHTIGGDVRWVAGGLTIQPTIYFQWGKQECNAAVGCATTQDVDIKTGIADVIVGYRFGPLNLQARGMYTPGNTANQSVQQGDDINYYRPINPGFAYMTGWSNIWTGGIDYAQALLAGAPGVSMRTSPSYDKYGRMFLALAADYALTPALTINGLVSGNWTAEKVDTQSALTANGLTQNAGNGGGDQNFLGTEANAGLTYRFAPNVALDLVGAYLWAGPALAHARAGAGDTKHDADDVWNATARVRVTW